jgi:hypothetical protein
MQTCIIKPDLSIIQSKIYEIREHKVILDFDLAAIYEIENKYLKRSVRSNIERFEGDDFMFELTREELSRCNFCTLNKEGRGSNIKYLPFAFTELGVAMLSSVLNSPKAIEINRGIMRVFVALRQYAANYAHLNHKLEDYMDKTNTRFDDVYEVLDELINHKREMELPRNPVGFVFGKK